MVHVAEQPKIILKSQTTIARDKNKQSKSYSTAKSKRQQRLLKCQPQTEEDSVKWKILQQCASNMIPDNPGIDKYRTKCE